MIDTDKTEEKPATLDVESGNVGVEISDEGEGEAKGPDGGFGWVIVFASFWVHVVTMGTMYTFGNFSVHYVEYAFPTELTSFSVSFIGTMQTGFMMIGGVVSGRLADKYGFRTMMLIGTAVATVGLVLASIVTHAWQLFITQGFLFGIGCSILYFPAVSAPSHWFTKRRGLAIGIAVAGSGVGGLALSPAVEAMINGIGWRWCLRVLALLLLTVVGSAAFIIRRRLPPSNNTGGLIDLSAFKDRIFLAMFWGGFFTSLGYLVPFYLITPYGSTINLTSSQTSLALGIMNGASAVGRIALGTLADHTGRLNTLAACMLMAAATMLLLWSFASTYGIVMAFAVVYGFFGGGFVSLFPSTCASLWGVDRVATYTGVLYASAGVASLFGTPIASAIQKSSGYEATIVYASVMILVGVAGCVAARLFLSRKLFKVV